MERAVTCSAGNAVAIAMGVGDSAASVGSVVEMGSRLTSNCPQQSEIVAQEE
jgi:hypothetical protein